MSSPPFKPGSRDSRPTFRPEGREGDQASGAPRAPGAPRVQTAVYGSPPQPPADPARKEGGFAPKDMGLEPPPPPPPGGFAQFRKEPPAPPPPPPARTSPVPPPPPPRGSTPGPAPSTQPPRQRKDSKVSKDSKESGSGPRHLDRPVGDLPAIARFGDYDIVGRLAMGGMAEILLARETAPGGGVRTLVVKRILPNFADDQQFVQMFLDEAKLVMRLTHPNICQIYKFGQQDGSYFIAMEFINGVPLGKLIRRARPAGLPIPIAVRAIAQVAEALHYAHHATDDLGRKMGIVHRDVSPHNVMIAYSGAVKLLDFGVAKATEHASKTQAGVVKGKFAYMAPEQCQARDIDGRADIFALGVCLWETLTGRPLYHRDTEYETMKMIIDGPVPSLKQGKGGMPADLDALVMKALAKDKKDRFQTAGEMQEALETWLAKSGSVVTSSKIAAYLEELYKEEIQRGPLVDSTPFGSSFHSQLPAEVIEERKPTEVVQNPVGLMGQFEMDASQVPAAPVPAAPERLSIDLSLPAAPPRARPHRPSGRLAASVRDASGRVVVEPMGRPRSEGGLSSGVKIGIGIFVAVVLLAVGGALGYRWWREQQQAAVAPVTLPAGQGALADATVLVTSAPPGATVRVGDRVIPGVTPLTISDLAPGEYPVVIELDGYETWRVQHIAAPGETSSIVATLVQSQADGPPGQLSLESRPAGTKVYLRGRLIGQTPLRRVAVPSGALELELEPPRGEKVRRAVWVRPGQDNPVFLDLTQPE